MAVRFKAGNVATEFEPGFAEEKAKLIFRFLKNSLEDPSALKCSDLLLYVLEESSHLWTRNSPPIPKKGLLIRLSWVDSRRSSMNPSEWLDWRALAV